VRVGVALGGAVGVRVGVFVAPGDAVGVRVGEDVGVLVAPGGAVGVRVGVLVAVVVVVGFAGKPTTATGMSRSLVVPSPSLPEAFQPQQRIRPSSISAQVCA
jgi:hypothetical protein